MDGSLYTGGVPSETLSDTQRAGSHLEHGGKIFIFIWRDFEMLPTVMEKNINIGIYREGVVYGWFDLHW